MGAAGKFEDLKDVLDVSFMGGNFGCFDGTTWCGDKSREWQSMDTFSGLSLGSVFPPSSEDVERSIKAAVAAQKEWIKIPAPRRGLIVREIGIQLSLLQKELSYLISAEMGKILKESEGEVQEFIDICNFACGLSRQLPGCVFPSERLDHFLMEVWHPIGTVGIVTAFNFPVAVLGWNLCISLVCGNTNIWKPSDTTPLVSIALSKIILSVLRQHEVPNGVFICLCGGQDVGKQLVASKDVNLISFTGSTNVGKEVSQVVHSRFGKCILELGGNNAAIVMDDADVELVVKSCLFAAVGTCGQRCTSLRRMYIMDGVYDKVISQLAEEYKKINVGDPLDNDILCGPLHTEQSVQKFMETIEKAKEGGGKILAGGTRIQPFGSGGCFVDPTIIEFVDNEMSYSEVIGTETFAPILFVFKIQTLAEGIKLNNCVTQGLSSTLFTKNLVNAFEWIGPSGSDCGIVNVNIGTSGAEIGGAFGGEKLTGGGRESGSDSWKQYMRRATCTINYSRKLPALSQGIDFVAGRD